MAAVNREWHAVALPLFYRTAYVVIGGLLGTRNVDDRDDGDMTIDDEAQSEEVGEEQNEASSVGRGDGWPSDDDEELLNTVGLSRDGVDIGLRTNISLICAAGLAGNARKVHIIVQGMGLTAGQILRQLVLAQFGRYEWASVERLRFDNGNEYFDLPPGRRRNFTKAFATINEMLSLSLPSLNEISYRGYGMRKHHEVIPIEQLINERLRGPNPLRVLRVESDCSPEFTGFSRLLGDAPLSIECFILNCSDNKTLCLLPLLMANTLVELTLGSVDPHWVWAPFVGNNATREPNGHLLFPCLQSLTLIFAKRCEEQFFGRKGYMGLALGYIKGNRSATGRLPDCTKSLHYGRPMLPALTRLDIRHFTEDLQGFLSLFANCPISKLMLSCYARVIPEKLDLTLFRGLRSLEVVVARHPYDNIGNRVSKALSRMFSTASPGLQHLAVFIDGRPEYDL
ncbi:hypothetical protein GGI17_004143 [Coemansia sp. S146]|nr:hypothetical protein GGI17_004143 [Coemansia sp. S146]